MIIVWSRRRGKVRKLASLCLIALHIPHCLYRILKLFMLLFPLRFFFLAKIGLKFGGFLLNFHLTLMSLDFEAISFADSLMFTDSIWIECSPASTTRSKVIVITSRKGLLGHFHIVALAFSCDGLLWLAVFSQRTLIDVRFTNHWVRFAGFLMWYQWFLVKTTAAIFALYKCFFDEGVERLRIELIYICFGDAAFAGQLLKTFWSSWAWSPLFWGFEIFGIFPFLLASLDVDRQTVGTEPSSSSSYSRPQI